jgi:hypothetical protein
MHYVFFLERLLFYFFSWFSLFVCCKKWLITSCWFGGRHTSLFIFEEHSVFHSYRFNECSLFLLLRLDCIFRLDLCSYIDLSFHWGVFFASDIYWFSSKEVFIKSSNGVRKEKKLYAKKWYKKELV